MPQVNRSPLLRYGLAVLTVSLAVLLTSIIASLYTRTPFALFFIAIMVSTLYGGRGAGLLATALSAIATAYFILPPVLSVAIGIEEAFMLAVFIFVALVISSLTERSRLAETSARATQEQLSTTLMSVGDAVIATDTEGRITLMNSVAQTVTGWTQEEARGKPLAVVFKTINEYTRREAEDPVMKVLREGSVVGLANHTILIAKDGREIPIDDSGAPIRDAEGNITGVVLVFQDVSELKQADAKMRFQAHLLDVVEQAMMATDLDGRITYWNQFAEKLYGWKAEEVLGRNIVDVIPTNASREQAAEIIAQLQKGESWSGDFQVQHRDGRTFPARVTDSPVYDESGKQIGIIGSSEDISERHRAEAALRESEERYRVVAETASDAIITIDEESVVRFVNNAAERIFGYPVEEILDQSLTMLMPDYLRHVHRAGFGRYLETGHKHISWNGVELPGLHKLGHEIPLELSFSEFTKDGQRFFTGIARDITERKQAEEALRESESRFRMMADNAPVLIWISGTDKHRNYFNKTWLDFTGRTMEQEMGNGWAEGVHPEDLETCLDIYTTSFDARQEFVMDYRLRLFDGEYRWVLDTGIPRWMPDGSFVGYIGSCVDITERKEVEEQQGELLAREQGAREQAELANRTKDEFLATLSHELRTPLTAMLGWTWMLRSRELEKETYDRALETIERNVRAQAQLIDDLLDVSRIITGNLRLDVRPSELVPVIEAAMDIARPAAEAKGIKLEAELDRSASHALCDPARIQQVLWNLLANAVKFTPKNGRVSVRLDRVDSHLEISVTDTGAGISAEFLPYVFDRFRQADSSTTRMHGGLGLGLAIVRHLVELHGGMVRVASKGEGEGSVFTVSLPLMAVAGTVEATPLLHSLTEIESDPQLDCALTLKELKILVVDDEPDARSLLVAALQQCGAEATAVASAREALDALSKFKMDVLVSDIGMPLEDGYMLIGKVRELETARGGRRMPAIALTAYASEQARDAALEAGFQIHLAKPIEPSNLIDAISRLIDKRED